MPVVLVEDLNMELLRLNATCQLTSLVERFGFGSMCYTDSTMPASKEGNGQLYACALE